MELEDVKDYMKGMFEVEPEVAKIGTLIRGFEDAGLDAPTYDEVRKACDALVEEGILQVAGREGYEATLAYMEEMGHEVGEERPV